MPSEQSSSDDRAQCDRPSCNGTAIARWHDGMWTTKPLCLNHMLEKLDARDRLDSYVDEVTTKANWTTIGDYNKVRVVPAGAKPIAGPWSCIRSKEALEHWVEQHDPEVAT